MEVKIPIELARYLKKEAEKMVSKYTYEYHDRLHRGCRTSATEYQIRVWRRVASLIDAAIKDATDFSFPDDDY